MSVQRALKLDLHPHKNFLCIQKIVAFVHFCSLIFVLLVGFCLRCVFVRLKSFCKKIINRLELALITSCTILLLDIRFNENMATYIPYKKSNNINFIYINQRSNHPYVIIKNLLKIIRYRLCRNSSKKEIFNESRGINIP